MKAEKNVAVVILAAGNSGRMAFPKLFLKYDDDVTFIEKIISVYYSFGCRQIIMVLNQEVYDQYYKRFPDHRSDSKFKLVLNEHPEYERFYSIQLGIAALEKTTHCFIQNVDNPFVSNVLLEQILNSVHLEDYYVPVFKGKGGHPILINEKVIKAICQTEIYDRKLNRFLQQFCRKNIETKDNAILRNINNMKDYSVYFKYICK
jgi:molybdenum cofactor cytidylyltransferase